jgi:hypothetical protein
MPAQLAPPVAKLSPLELVMLSFSVATILLIAVPF